MDGDACIVESIAAGGGVRDEDAGSVDASVAVMLEAELYVAFDSGIMDAVPEEEAASSSWGLGFLAVCVDALRLVIRVVGGMEAVDELNRCIDD